MMTKTQRETANARKRAAAERRRQETQPPTVIDWDERLTSLYKMLDEHELLEQQGR